MPHLKTLFEQEAASGEVYVITRYRDCTQNLRTQFERIIRNAGLVPWEKLWQNLRSTRSTELGDQFPGPVVAAWLGHSERIADRHYRQVTDEHFVRANGKAEKVTRNPTRQPVTDGDKPCHTVTYGALFSRKNERSPENRGFQVADTGLEQSGIFREFPGETGTRLQRGLQNQPFCWSMGRCKPAGSPATRSTTLKPASCA